MAPAKQSTVPRKSRGSVSEGSKLQIEKEGFRLNSRSHVIGRGEQENELAFLIPYTHPDSLPLFLPVGIRKNLLLAHVGLEGGISGQGTGSWKDVLHGWASSKRLDTLSPSSLAPPL